MTDTISTIELATDLTVAWLENSNTRATAADVPAFLQAMHDTLTALAAPSQVDADPATNAEQHTPAVSVRKSLASPDHVTNAVIHGLLGELPRCLFQALDVLLTRLLLALRPVLLVLPHPSVHLLPDGIVQHRQVRAPFGDHEHIDVTLSLRLLAHGALVSCWVIVFKDEVATLA